MRQKKKQTGAKKGAGIRTVLLLLLTAIVMVAGFFLPSVLLNREREALRSSLTRIELGVNIGNEEITPFAVDVLTRETLAKLLGLQEDFGYNIFYHEPSQGEMTEEQAVAQMQLELGMLADLGLIPQSLVSVYDAQYTALLGTRIYTARNAAGTDPLYDIWEIFVYSPELTITIDLHASSGKILSISADIMKDADPLHEEYRKAVYQNMEAMAQRFVEYLGVQPSPQRTGEALREENESVMISYQEGFLVEFSFYETEAELHFMYSLF
ncbi:MAG: hypothetical protein IJR00_06170 [Lachnospiraceae bacterium]|nr:hypothetical protein [Lachnospiraceae bacterium]